MREAQEDIRKLGDSSGGSRASGASSTGDLLSGLGAGLLKAGLIRDLGNSVAGFAGTLVESSMATVLGGGNA